MQTVGIRELKNRLSEYLRRVRAGGTILVTDRGRIVAELRPPGTGDLDSPRDTLERLAREGRVRVGERNRPDLYPVRAPALTDGRVAELLDWERGER